jgi:tRNA(fMet)-specific endonuclease VapC
MSRYCLDTSAYSHFKRGDPEAVTLITTASWVGVSSIALGELRTGFALGRHRDRNEAELREFLADPVVRTLDVDDAASVLYSEMVVSLRRAGTPLPTNDIWIAAVAAREAAAVLTYDAHFTSIVRVGVRVLSRP